jgi:hypothetical protein
MMMNESMMSSDEFCHVPHVLCVMRSCEGGPARGSVYIGRLTVVAQRVAPVHSTG